MTSFLDEVGHPVRMAAQSALLIVLLVIFKCLWLETEKSGLRVTSSATELLWYVAAAETIFFSTPQMYRAVQADIREGAIFGILLRPTSFIGIHVCMGLGAFFGRFLVIGMVSFFTAILLTGQLPHGSGLALFFISASFAGLSLILIFLLIGLLSAWIEDCLPVYWICSKCLFVFGGLVVPLNFYPNWFQQLAAWLPFEPILFGSAQGMLTTSSISVTANCIKLIAWCLLLGVFARVLHGRHLKRLLREGR